MYECVSHVINARAKRVCSVIWPDATRTAHLEVLDGGHAAPLPRQRACQLVLVELEHVHVGRGELLRSVDRRDGAASSETPALKPPKQEVMRLGEASDCDLIVFC